LLFNRGKLSTIIPRGGVILNRKKGKKLHIQSTPVQKNGFRDFIKRLNTLIKKYFTLKAIVRASAKAFTLTAIIGIGISLLNYSKPYFSSGTAYYEKAVESYKQEDYVQAEKYFNNAKESDPRIKKVDYYLGLIKRYKEKDESVALKYFLKVPSDDPLYESAQKEIVWYYFEKNDLSALEKHLYELLKVNPESVYGRIALNSILVNKQDYKQLEIESKKTIDYYASEKIGRSTFNIKKGNFDTRKYDKVTELGYYIYPDTFYKQMMLVIANLTLSDIEVLHGNEERAYEYANEAMDICVPIRTNVPIKSEINLSDYQSYFKKSDDPVIVFNINNFSINDEKYCFVPLKVVFENNIKDFEVKIDRVTLPQNSIERLKIRYSELSKISTNNNL
jgi:tetratricopeptide (TPR) repeat protein